MELQELKDKVKEYIFSEDVFNRENPNNVWAWRRRIKDDSLTLKTYIKIFEARNNRVIEIWAESKDGNSGLLKDVFFEQNKNNLTKYDFEGKKPTSGNAPTFSLETKINNLIEKGFKVFIVAKSGKPQP